MRAALLSLLLALGCGGDSDDVPTRTGSEEVPVAPSEPRAPLGAEQVQCVGTSVDPHAELDALVRTAEGGDTAAAIEGLEALAGAHPGSATTRVRLGEVLLWTQPPSAERAERWFDLALALHDRGCRLEPRPHWTALEGAALSRMMQGDYADAIRFLEASLAVWPGSRQTHYNLACSRCQTGDVDRCASELRTVIQGELTVPEEIADQSRPPRHYAELARRDPDLAPLRQDEARFESIVSAGGRDPAAP